MRGEEGLLHLICPDCGTGRTHYPKKTTRSLSRSRVKCMNPDCDKSYYIKSNMVRVG